MSLAPNPGPPDDGAPAGGPSAAPAADPVHPAEADPAATAPAAATEGAGASRPHPLESLVTRFDRVDRPRARAGDVTASEFLEGVRRGDHRDLVEDVRSERDPGLRRRRKLDLQVVTTSGRFLERKGPELIQHSSLIALDYDGFATPAAAEAFRDRAAEHPNVLAAFLSVSGLGVAAIVSVEVEDEATGEHRPPETEAEHKRAYAAAAASGPPSDRLDPSGSDLARGRFVSYDPDLRVNPDAAPIRVPAPSLPTPPPPRDRPAGRWSEDRIRRVLRAVASVGRPNYPTWFRISAATLAALSGDQAHAMRLLVEAFGEEEPGEYQRVFEGLTGEITAGTLAYYEDHYAAEKRSPPLGVNLSTVVARETLWVWACWLAAGKLVLVDGDPGVGKSTLYIALAASVTAGVPWPDGTAVAPGARGVVVIVTSEDDMATTILPRVLAAGGDPALVVVIETVPDGKGGSRLPRFHEDVDLIVGECVRLGAKLLVIDPVVAYMGRADTHRDADVRAALTPLAAAAERAGLTVLLVRHLNKSTGASALHRGGGSIGFAGLARTVWLVGKDPRDASGQRRVLATLKNNLAAFPESIEFRLEQSGPHGASRVVWTGPSPLSAEDLVRPAAPPSRAPALDEATAFLRQALASGPVPSDDLLRLAQQAGISETTLKRARKELGVRSQREGGLGKDGRWVNHLPEA